MHITLKNRPVEVFNIHEVDAVLHRPGHQDVNVEGILKDN